MGMYILLSIFSFAYIKLKRLILSLLNKVSQIRYNFFFFLQLFYISDVISILVYEFLTD